MEEVQEIVEQEEGVMQRETQIVQDYADVSLCPHSLSRSVVTDSSSEIKLFIRITLPYFIVWIHGN